MEHRADHKAFTLKCPWCLRDGIRVRGVKQRVAVKVHRITCRYCNGLVQVTCHPVKVDEKIAIQLCESVGVEK